MNKIAKAINNPLWAYGVIMHRCFSRYFNDRTFIKFEYLSGMGHFPDLENPKTYNEKLQWLKLNDIHEEYTQLVDKYKAKEYVRNILGDEYIIPTLGVWNSFDEIDFDKLPNQFVLKTTHDSGGVVVCPDKSKLDIAKAKKKLEKSLKNNFFYKHREYPYKNVKPRIIAEKFMVDESGTELKDYKFYCFNGESKMLLIATDRSTEVKFDFFDSQFNHLPFTKGHPNSSKKIVKPEGYEEMKHVADKLCTGFPHVRVDLYNINGKIYFGELTFFPAAGNVPFEPAVWDKTIGDWLELPESK